MGMTKKMADNKRFIDGAMRYHKIVLLIVTMLVVIGIVGLIKMPKQEIPTIVVRQGLVVAAYPGATSAQVEERVTKPLENFIFEYKEVDKEKTYSHSKDGLAIVYVELNDNILDRDAFWAKFKHGLEAFKTQLPSGPSKVTKRPTANSKNTSNNSKTGCGASKPSRDCDAQACSRNKYRYISTPAAWPNTASARCRCSASSKPRD